jgi:hypothetical protein
MNASLGYSPFPVWGLSMQPDQRSKDSTTFGIILIRGAALNGGTRKSTREVTGNQNLKIHPVHFFIALIWLIVIFRSRDDKRYTEKKNKSERARRKKEDTAKLRGLVDLTLR